MFIINIKISFIYKFLHKVKNNHFDSEEKLNWRIKSFHFLDYNCVPVWFVVRPVNVEVCSD